MKNFRADILLRPVFIAALGLLLLNDFYLKYQYSNFITGKLSDFTGLFIFPYFLSSLQTKWKKIIYSATALLFIFWKSNLSQEIIEWIQLAGIGINRVIDYSDLYALIILPVSYKYLNQQLTIRQRIHKTLSIPLSLISLFAIWATTLPKEKVDINIEINKTFELQMSKADFFKSISAGHRYSDTLSKNLNDSLFYLSFNIHDYNVNNVMVLATVKNKNSSVTTVRLDSIYYGYVVGSLFTGVNKKDKENFKSLNAKEFATYFEKNFIIPIKISCIICLLTFYYTLYLYGTGNWGLLAIMQKVSFIGSILLVLGLEYFTKQEDFKQGKLSEMKATNR